jgi:ATP-dependent Zn protease
MAKGNASIGEIRKKVTKTHEYISGSYHEAGHTVYALLHAMRVSSVAVFENKKLKRIHGITYYDYPSELEDIEDSELLLALVRADIAVSYAGLVAEKTLFKSISGSSKTPLFISDGSTEDNQSASEMIKKYNLAPPGIKRAAYKAKLIREVNTQLHENWDAVTLIAHALFEHRRLTYNDLQELLTKRSRKKKFWKEQFKKINYFFDNNETLDEKDFLFMLSR